MLRTMNDRKLWRNLNVHILEGHKRRNSWTHKVFSITLTCIKINCVLSTEKNSKYLVF